MQTSFDTVAPAQPSQAASALQSTAAAQTGGSGEMSFHQILSCLNPLQYVPVVGMIYRAVTGDTIPEPIRVAGGLAFSALTGGPIGVVLSAATEVLEQATGIDPEKIGHSVLASIGLASPNASGNHPAIAVASASKAADPATAPAGDASADTAAVGAAELTRRNQAYAWAAEPVIGSGG